MEPKVIKESEARVFLDGQELCREYIATGKITFGTSTLLPGQRGGIDPGHPDSHEIFYVSRGHVIMNIAGENQYYELKEGDIIIIPEGKPHELTNVGTEKAIITWSCAPSPV
ncbi:cupin domain-containing protein [Petroclostridium sp. X23]|uniref:cupin domain-containing protein n=1 Tax=Petroclostridium sp. X23 TaxID=3045146 RepID=UPI0024AE8472|nr:cupin domain-containing protein [Petroclostridium sp. X23]WHH60484.1 cupin domain-containing protein [Petroclostridium sp. X23]